MMTDLWGSLTVQGIDDAHGALGARCLQALVGPMVAGPVALHVAAKRYLVAVRPGYMSSLSADSLRSLALQGGPMSAPEAGRFESLDYAANAQRLRKGDDLAKDSARRSLSKTMAQRELEALLTLSPVG